MIKNGADSGFVGSVYRVLYSCLIGRRKESTPNFLTEASDVLSFNLTCTFDYTDK